MTSTEFPETLTTIEDLRALAGHKVTLEFDYMWKDRRKPHSRPVKRTQRTVGTIKADDRGQLDERYCIHRRSQANIIYAEGQRVAKVWG